MLIFVSHLRIADAAVGSQSGLDGGMARIRAFCGTICHLRKSDLRERKMYPQTKSEILPVYLSRPSEDGSDNREAYPDLS